MPRLPSVRRMLGPTQKQRGRPESRNYRNVTRGDEDGDGGGGGGDDDDRRRGKTAEGRKRAREGGREKKVSLDEGDGRRSSCFVWSRPCTMQNSASNSKAVRQSAASLFARCESSRFFRGGGEGANRSLNPNERLRARKREKTRKEFAEREQRRKGYSMGSNSGSLRCPVSHEIRGGRPTQAIVITKMSNI